MRPGPTTAILLWGLLAAGAILAAPGDRSTLPPRATRVDTNNYALEGFLRDMVSEFKGSEGRWSFNLYDVEMILISDEPNDRMRLIAPIAPAGKLDEGALRVLMEANFDRALDAKYAIWRDTVWGTYAHPLSTLTEVELKGAALQVAGLLRNYGTSFSSTDLHFGND